MGKRSGAGGKLRLARRPASDPNTNVVIVAGFGSDVERYSREFAQLSYPRPTTCPHCDSPDRLIGHGSYPRSAVDHLQKAIPIRVRRFRCATCQKTVSLLPSFCLPWRHYQTATIQAVLDWRFVAQASWKTLQKQFSSAGLPVFSTLRAWARTYARESRPFLQRLLQQLARWQLGLGKLEVAVEELARYIGAPRQLIAAVPHLVAFLAESGLHIAEATTPWLSKLWQWGHSQKLGRLV